MAFMTIEEIKAVRMKGSKVITIEGIGKEVRIIKMRADAQNRSAELHQEIAAGRRPKHDAILFMLEHALAELDGSPLTADDAKTLFELLEMPELLKLVGIIGEHIGQQVKVSEAPQAEMTPAEKKG